jgi:aspartyl-tRNA(Asn)/glutamyl-tRNA(Gln) amidotransferase subunit A
VSKEISGNFLDWDLVTLSDAIRNKQISPVEVTRKMLERIAAENDQLNAYITVTDNEALAQAAQAEKEINAGNMKGYLHGIPIALKDLIYTKDITTTMGSEIYSEYIPDYDAAAVEKLKEAGAVIIGKLNTHQFAYGATGDRSFFGPVRNPYDTSKVSGGSSSGSGAAVAASLCYASLGTDTGGSIRIPSSFGGIVGMRPTFGLVSTYGVFPLCKTLDTIGPMTKTVKDNAVLLSLLAGFDERDLHSIQKDPEDFTRYLDKGVEGTVIGVPPSNFFDHVNEEITRDVHQAIETFRSLGAEIRTVEIPDLEQTLAAFRVTLKSEAYSGHVERLQEYPASQWDEEVRERLLTGSTITAHEYIQAQQVKQWAIREYNKMFSEVDVLVIPALPILPFDINQREIKINDSMEPVSLQLNRFTGSISLIGFPSLTVPCGMSSAGLPIGLQLVGKPFDEANLYRFGSALMGGMNNV